MDEKTIARFWGQVDRRGPDECWEWRGRRKHGKTYGFFRVGGRQGRTLIASRVSWMLTHGPIPNGMCILHRCDNPPCCNPAHLFLGTQLDNIRDRDRKGRQRAPRGSGNGSSRLTEADVEHIRARLSSGDKGNAIAREFGVGTSTISRIRGRRAWCHVI